MRNIQEGSLIFLIYPSDYDLIAAVQVGEDVKICEVFEQNS